MEKALDIRHASYFPFLVIFLISAGVSAVALRHNNETMVSLRQAVYDADKNNGDVNSALNNLRSYVYDHMNTDLSSGTGVKPPIQLKYTYERLQSQAQGSTGNAGLYTEAENYCQQKIPASVSFYGAGRISCVTDYISSHGGKPAPAIPTGLYEFDFASPTWSPDFAGWSLAATAIAGVAFIVSFLRAMFKNPKLPKI